MIRAKSPLTFLTLLLLVVLIFISCKKDKDTIEPIEPTVAMNLFAGELTDCPATDDQKEFIKTLNEGLAHTFDGANPSISDEGLTDLIDYLGDTRFVGLGEGTHGTKEFFQMKEKIFRALVMEKDFKAIIFESPWGNCQVINDYVVHNIGTAESALSGIGYWIYTTDEVLSLVKWIHNYNQSQSEENKVFFVGNDPQGDNFVTEIKIIREYLEGIGIDSLSQLMDNYKDLPTSFYNSNYSEQATAIHNANIAGVNNVINYLKEHEVAFVNKSSTFDFQVVLMAADVIRGRELVYRTNGYGEKRDELMARYTELWQKAFGAESKVCVWMHNFHIANSIFGRLNTTGAYLNKLNTDNYKAVGFSFGKGSFNAFLTGSNFEFLGYVSIQNIPDYQCNTNNYILSLVDKAQYYLIFDELKNSTVAQNYIGKPQPFTSIGAGFNIDFIDKHFTHSKNLSRIFDVLIHFDETKASSLR